MAYETVLYDKSGHVVTLTLNRPDRLNTFSPQLSSELQAGLAEAEADPEVRCIILTGAGRAFSAGADVSNWNKSPEVQDGSRAASASSGLVTPWTVHRLNYSEVIMGMVKPVICALNGVAVGMASAIVLSCDIRLMSETARIAFQWVARGLATEYSATFLLPKVVGFGVAKELCLTGRFVDAKEAKEIRLVSGTYPPDQLMPAAMEVARTIASLPPISITLIKRGLNLSLDATHRATVDFEDMATATCMRTEDFRESVRAFMEKREPTFKGR